MGRGKADPMRHIQRAAVTGLFALWLAPLATTAAQAQSSPSLRADRTVQAERTTVESRQDEDEEPGEATVTPRG